MDQEQLYAALKDVKTKLDDIIKSFESAAPTTLVYVLALDGGEDLVVPDEWIKEWSSSYGPTTTVNSIIEACQWSKDNPAKRKTKRGARKFLGSWILRNYKNSKTIRTYNNLAGKYGKR